MNTCQIIVCADLPVDWTYETRPRTGEELRRHLIDEYNSKCLGVLYGWFPPIQY